MKLRTLQKHNRLNSIWTTDPIGPGGAHHEYAICKSTDEQRQVLQEINFQKGPRDESTSVDGILDVDLLEIVRDRLASFQAGEFRCRENACALTHIEEALMWMNRRVEDRYERGVLGTMEK